MWENIHANDFGWTGQLRVVQDLIVQDISSYTTLLFILRSPTGTVSSKTASFATDGTDGILEYTFQEGDITTPGDWYVQARIAKSDVELTTDKLLFTVKKRI